MPGTVLRIFMPYKNTSEILRSVIPILWLRKLRHGEVKQLARGHTAKSLGNSDFSLGQSGLLNGLCSCIVLSLSPDQEGMESTFKGSQEWGFGGRSGAPHWAPAPAQASRSLCSRSGSAFVDCVVPDKLLSLSNTLVSHL